MYGLFVAVLLGVTPKANLQVFGPPNVSVGQIVFLDASGSVSEFPLTIQVSPSDGSRGFVLDTVGSAAFVASREGVYHLTLAAAGWDDTKTHLQFAVATQTLTVGAVPPPAPPLPTDPLAQAAFLFRKDFESAYSANYASAAASVKAKGPLVPAKQAMAAAISKAVSDSYSARFAAWIPQMPPSGQEPMTDGQWQVTASVFSAIAVAFGN